jgi:hypothetical protein
MKRKKPIIVIPVSETLKAKLDEKRRIGFTLNGFVRHVLEQALADTPVPRRKGKRVA